MLKTYDLKKLDWDTSYFEVSSSRADLFLQLSDLEKKELSARMKEYDFITVINKNCNNQNNLWLSRLSNSFLVDINVQYYKRIDNIKYTSNQNEFVHLSSGENIEDELINIARSAFVFSRFYNDPYLSKEKTKNIYVEWIKSSITDKSKMFCIHKHNDEIEGFLLFSILEKQAKIELVAVKSAVTNKGIGRSMINYLQEYLKTINVESIIVGTQIANINANNFYTKCGFTMKDNSAVFHIWNRYQE